MIFHKMKYTFKYLFKNKVLLFWTFIFPLVLGTCFYVAFKNIESEEKLNVFDIAIVNTDEFDKNEIYKSTFEALSKEDDDQLFNIDYVTKEEAEKLLEDEKITGYLILNEEPTIYVKKSGIYETILKRVVDEIRINESMIMDMYLTFDETNFEMKINEIISREELTKDISNKNLSYMQVEYYTLIAMTALYSGMLAVEVMVNESANISSKGKRMSIAPIKKVTSIIGSLLASYIVGLIGLTILFLYTIFVIKADYGNELAKVITIGVVGTFAGTALGMFVGTVFKGNSNSKTGILIAITMFGSFCSGMMGVTMKYIIDTYIPLLNKINPAAMITDGLYSIYYYDTFNRYYFDLTSLIVLSLVLIIISIISMRRAKYECI